MVLKGRSGSCKCRPRHKVMIEERFKGKFEKDDDNGIHDHDNDNDNNTYCY